jgi:outer membrane lipoprotein-sorting protein
VFGGQPNTTKNLDDPNAKVLLDAATKTFKSYPSVQADFTVFTEYPQSKTQTQSGKLFLKAEKYKIILDNQEIYCDKNTVWTYLKDLNEVQINDYEPSKTEITPANMFTIYQTDFHYMLNGKETAADGISYSMVDLMPKDKTKPYFKVRLWIDTKYNIKRLKIFDKNGTRYTYTINKMNTTQKLDDAIFIFDPQKYSGIHIEDLRL